jgi:hypothetical protein
MEKSYKKNTLLKKIISLDIFDINYIYGSEKLRKTNYPQKSLPKKGYFVRLFSLLHKTFLNLLRCDLFYFLRLDVHKIIFFIGTNNQYSTLSPVRNKCFNSELVLIDYENKLTFPGTRRFPLFISYLLSIPFLSIVIKKYKTGTDYQKETFKYSLEEYMTIYGNFILFYYWFKWKKPTAVILSNDHVAIYRTILYTCNELHIPTVFIPHASSTKFFPPLKFTYSLLEGIETVNNYLPNIYQSKIYLIGIPKFDNLIINKNDHKEIKVIGIATNPLDSISEFDHIINMLVTSFPNCEIFLRPHPSDKNNNNWKLLAQKYKINFSNPLLEDSIDYLLQTDLLIAGNSNILLEAALLNIIPISYTPDQEIQDWYGFHQKNIIFKINSTTGIKKFLLEHRNNRINIKINLKGFCDTINTPYEGSSSLLANILIDEIRENSKELEKNKFWQKVVYKETEIHKAPGTFSN